MSYEIAEERGIKRMIRHPNKNLHKIGGKGNRKKSK